MMRMRAMTNTLIEIVLQRLLKRRYEKDCILSQKYGDKEYVTNFE